MRETELGFVLLLLGKDQEALWEFREVPWVDPGLPRASSGLGITLVILRMRRGEPEPDFDGPAEYPTQRLYSTTRPIRFGQPAVTATRPLEYRQPPEVPD